MQTDEGLNIIQLLESPFYNRRFKYFTVTGSDQIFDILTSTRFYPVILPHTSSLVSLEVTSQSIESRIDELRGKANVIVTANLHSTSQPRNYVTYGQVYRNLVTEKMFDSYLECMNFGLMTSHPLIIRKSNEKTTTYQPISDQRYFPWINTYQFEKETIDVTFNVLLTRFSARDFRDASEVQLKFKGQEIPVIEVTGHVLSVGLESQYSFFPIEFSLTKKLYKQMTSQDLRCVILQVYSLYNMRKNEKTSKNINIITGLIPFDNSYEQILPFVSTSFKRSGMTLKCEIPIQFLESVRREAMEGTAESLKEIHSQNNLYSYRYKGKYLEFSIFNPRLALELIKTSLSLESNSDLITAIFESDDMVARGAKLYNSLKNGRFFDGDYVHPKVCRDILQCFDFQLH